jgi:hypothetical protein
MLGVTVGDIVMLGVTDGVGGGKIILILVVLVHIPLLIKLIELAASFTVATYPASI